MARINLVDLGFNSFSEDEKRISFITMDMVMKDMHKKNKYVTSFIPQDIYFDNETTLFTFSKYTDDSKYVADNREQAINNNIIGLSTLAFCSYLRTYDPKDGLLNNSVLASEFSKFIDIMNPNDVEYYKKVLVDGYNTDEIGEPIYYSDAILEKEKATTNSGVSDGRVLQYATAAGRAMADRDQEAAFGTQFFFVSMVACTMIALLGIILYFINI